MKLHEEASTPSLARKLGDVPHVSGLAIRLARQSGAQNRLPEWLMRVAIDRGARHYKRDFDPTLPPDSPEVSDEEIGVALCLEQHAYNLDALRIAAQFLSSSRVDPSRLCHLAVQERCEPVLLHIAKIAGQYAPNQQPWLFLRHELAARRVARGDALPHWTRLVSYTGVAADGRPRAQWLSRDE